MRKYLLLITLFSISINNLFSQKVIEMNYENGIYTIPCKVNGIPMKFIFDTGASDVSISLTEAKFLIKQGLLNDEDVKGTVKYKIANGEIEEGTKIILKEINIDGYILENVEASIVHQLNAPLLLGQSAISKLGSFQLDGDKLIIRENKNDYYTFLNIDLTKTYSDFGFLQEAINQFAIDGFVPVEMSQVSTEKHFLSHLKLTERVVFDLKGQISFIILADKFENLIGFQKEETAKKKFENLGSEIKKKYGEPNSSSKRVSEWKSLHYEILLSLSTDNEIFLMYVPKVTYRNPINSHSNNAKSTEVKKEKPEKELSKKEWEEEMVKTNREFLLSSMKFLLNKGKYDESTFKGGVFKSENFTDVVFPRIENNDLNLYIEREYKNTSSSKYVYEKENNIINDTFYYLFERYIVSSSSSIDLVNMCELSNINFIFDFHYSNATTRSVERKIILKRNKLNIKFPFTKKEFFKRLQ
ncbi:TIGR02281 family clan AA aspartic protease [Lutibacter sp. B1]|nr:TIGR02281 family clan AA aspartic protease [Lutibacter sp. B1]